MMKSEEIKQISLIDQMIEQQREVKAAGRTIGFVPTMGFLHEGHLALIEQAREKYDYVVVSIFVNPTQFGPSEDFEAYPRNLDSDMRLAASAGVNTVFCPEMNEMYPQDGGIRIQPGQLANRLCGASRPGHFDGVLQVVLKLVNIIQPDGVFFGMKDAQQLAIIETFFRDYNCPADLIRVPTVRESDGLAKSSRNVNLTERERAEAPLLFESLQQGEVLLREGVKPEAIEEFIKETLEKKTSGTIDYVDILNYPQLTKPIEPDMPVIIACAVQFSKVRIIDNIILEREG